MFFEYALDPTVLTNFERIRYFHSTLGYEKGRLLARLPENFLSARSEELLKNVDGTKAVILFKLMKDIREATVRRRDSNWHPGSSWLTNILEEHRKLPFRGIVTKEGGNRKEILDPDLLTEKHVLWKAPNNKKIPKNPEVLAAMLALLFREARELYLVDPYLRGDNRWMPNVSALINTFLNEVIGQHRPQICLYFTIRKGKEDQQTVISNLRKALAPWRRRADINLHLVFPLPGERFHNRFLLTNLAGVCLHVGLDLAWSERDRDLLGILSHEVWEEEYQNLERLERNRNSKVFMV